jgi:hypothetical protein
LIQRFGSLNPQPGVEVGVQGRLGPVVVVVVVGEDDVLAGGQRLVDRDASPSLVVVLERVRHRVAGLHRGHAGVDRDRRVRRPDAAAGALGAQRVAEDELHVQAVEGEHASRCSRGGKTARSGVHVGIPPASRVTVAREPTLK